VPGRTRRSTPTDPPAEAQAAEPDGVYRHVPLAELAANPLNVRKRLTGIDELAESIRAVGILEPLVVTPGQDGGLLIVLGHRRYAAAEQAGLTSVPCIVRGFDEAQIIQTALIENGQRDNLTYLEEAEGLQRLMTLTALQVRDIAGRVGRSTQYVTGRLALLTLPDGARAALDAGAITLDTAQQLADLADQPDLIDSLIQPDGQVDPDRLDAARHRVAVDREAARLTEEAAAKGLRLLDREPTASGYAYLATLDLSPGQKAAHPRQSCHAAYLDRSYDRPRLVPVCTNPDRHRPRPASPPAEPSAPGRSGTAAQPSPGEPRPDADAVEVAGEDRHARWRAEAAEREREERERDRNRKRVAKARREFLATALSKRIKRADAAVFVFGSVLGRANENDLATAGRILGLTAQADQYGRNDWRTAVAAYAAADAEHLVKAAFVTCCAWAETRISPYTGYDAQAETYIGVLAALGYTPDPYETAELDAHRRRHAPGDHDDEPAGEPTGDPDDDEHDDQNDD
jgi:ParB/RepB/Spo0J family partition protein